MGQWAPIHPVWALAAIHPGWGNSIGCCNVLGEGVGVVMSGDAAGDATREKLPSLVRQSRAQITWQVAFK